MFAARTDRRDSSKRAEEKEPKTDPKAVIRDELTLMSRCYGATAQLPESFRDAVTVLQKLATSSPQ
jgi:hypothetical protein